MSTLETRITGTGAHRSPRANWWPRTLEPPQLLRREYGLAPVLALEALLLSALIPLAAWWEISGRTTVLIVVLLTTLVAAIRVAQRPFAGWVALIRRLLMRRRRSRLGHKIRGHNQLTAISPELTSGALPGPHRTEIGVLHDGIGWATALWVTEGPQADPENPDPLAALEHLPLPLYPATQQFVVLQQRTPDTGQHSQVTAWLSIKVDPLRHLSTRTAVGAVPALLRSELHRLIRSTHDGQLTLTSLDEADLVGALSACTDVPMASGRTAERSAESWGQWHCSDLTHQSFAVRPPATSDHIVLIAGVLGQAQSVAGSAVTVTLARTPTAGRLAKYPIVIRVTHANPNQTARLLRDLRRVSRSMGAHTLSLNGNQGPALLHTSVLAGQPMA